jgi:hypothetical protein
VALSISPAGKGQVAFFNVPLTAEGGDLIGSPMFPSLLHELLRTMRAGNEASPTPGHGFTVDVPTAGEGPLAVADPAGHPTDFRVISSGRSARLAVGEAALPGNYSISQAGRQVGLVAVNVDPLESDTRPLSSKELLALGNVNTTVVAATGSTVNETRARNLWPLFAGAAAAFLVLEMLLLSFWRGPRAGASPLAPASQAFEVSARPWEGAK